MSGRIEAEGPQAINKCGLEANSQNISLIMQECLLPKYSYKR
jgi:hypothetical protein